MSAAYKFSAEKAFAAVHWMVSRGVPVDLHAALKTCYFADKEHLNKYLRPIFGARYMAMKFGPVPLEIYEIMKGEGLWLWEVNALATPWRLEGYHLRQIANDVPDMSLFAQSEMEELERGFHRSVNMNFTARTAATHGRDWQMANGGLMKYEDMVEDSPNKEEIVRTIIETAPHIKL